LCSKGKSETKKEESFSAKKLSFVVKHSTNKIMLTVYGIPNCDTVKKSLTWLKEHGIEFEFHDYKKKGISPEKLLEWLTQESHTKLINRAGTTWKKLSDETKAGVTDNQSAMEVMLQNTSAIKRPIIESDKILALGFDVKKYEEVFG
jgi:arsenate reductase (glutaredoxin)